MNIGKRIIAYLLLSVNYKYLSTNSKFYKTKTPSRDFSFLTYKAEFQQTLGLRIPNLDYVTNYFKLTQIDSKLLLFILIEDLSFVKSCHVKS